MKKSILGLFIIVGIVTLLNAEFIRDDSKEIVVDRSTNLMWQDSSNVKNYTKIWRSAINYCENLDFAGYQDWRLPNINELESIVDYNKKYPSLNDIFKNFNSGGVWSSTSAFGANDNAWAIYFSDGYDNKLSKISGEYVRCVRDNN